MNRPVTIHALLLGIALVTAYFVWTRDTTTREDEIPILSRREGLDRVVYSAPKRVVEVQRKKDRTGTFYWVKVETVKEKPAPQPTPSAAPDAGAPSDKTAEKDKTAKPGPTSAPTAKQGPADAGPPKPKPTPKPKMVKVTERKEFKGNKSVEELIKGLSTLSAVRSLGKLDKDKLKAFGLEESKKTLTLIAGSTPRTFVIGGNTYGNLDVYVQDRQDKRVYVVRPRLLQDLQYAEHRLVDRSLHDFAPADVEQAALVVGKQRKILVQKNRQDPANAHWVEAESPDKRKDFYRNFMGKLLRLQAMEYVLPKDRNKQMTELLRASYRVSGGETASLILYSAGPPIAVPTADKKPAQSEFYAISSNTRALVKLNPRLADEVARDVPNLMKE